MKKTLFFAPIALLCASAAFGQPDAAPQAGLTLGSITWAATNVNEQANFAPQADMYTQLHTWGSNPCPTGWRVPTKEEFQALANSGSSWAGAERRGNSVAGRFFGPNNASCTMSDLTGCIFLPACGFRGTDGSVGNQGSSGYYWAQEEHSAANGFLLSFRASSTSINPENSRNKNDGRAVRCVR